MKQKKKIVIYLIEKRSKGIAIFMFFVALAIIILAVIALFLVIPQKDDFIIYNHHGESFSLVYYITILLLMFALFNGICGIWDSLVVLTKGELRERVYCDDYEVIKNEM